ncbi:hypothetical protein ACX80U_06130 [Arthrobacter sp. TmT3-37]|nr:hypothetical protein [Arthrobacter agilis]
MDPNRYEDHGERRRAPTEPRRRTLRMVLLLAIAVFAVSIAFVLVYATGLSWPTAVLITVVLAGGQAYTLRRTLFPGDGDDGTDP